MKNYTHINLSDPELLFAWNHGWSPDNKQADESLYDLNNLSQTTARTQP